MNIIDIQRNVNWKFNITQIDDYYAKLIPAESVVTEAVFNAYSGEVQRLTINNNGIVTTVHQAFLNSPESIGFLNKFFPEETDIELQISDEDYLKIAKAADRCGLSFSKFTIQAVIDQINNKERKITHE